MDNTITGNFSLFKRMEYNPIAQELPLLALMCAFVRFVGYFNKIKEIKRNGERPGNDGKNEVRAPLPFNQKNNFAHVGHVAHVLVLRRRLLLSSAQGVKF